MPTRKTNIRHIDAIDRQKAALSLKSQGFTYQQIADKLGYADSSGAYNAVKACMDLDRATGAHELRYLQNQQLEGILNIWLAEATAHLDPKTGKKKQILQKDGSFKDAVPNGAAADRVLRILHQQAELNGLLIQKIAPTDPSGDQYQPFTQDSGSATEVLNILAAIGVIPSVINGEYAELDDPTGSPA